ncbi:glycine--tRNA ligase subunit beta [Lacticaseibacillus mingshuiensis]|uniref:glycine--tRNA ligase subunit beta n=1 Tax=Lacticaseibacillus mingshuiensis TaxID=2799574 RepID=UPI00194FF47F|nr:glycine--tRNA ligase subunit beta [Lacticaseibacillus mingshuiensis]
MTHDYLLEIGLEDMPAHVVTPSLAQFKTKTAAFLKENHLTFGAITSFATPRRLALLVHDLADKQADTEEDVKGPAKKIAQDAEGNWSKAAIGFTRGQGMTVDDITFREIKGVEYVYLHKAVAGKQAAAILPGLIDVVKSLTFPTRMKWGNYDFEYIRPIHWLVSLLDDQVVPMQLLDIKTGRTTQGHRFLGKAVELTAATAYEDALAAQFVIVDPAKRKQTIADQINAIAKANDWTIDLDADLLEEVTNLVEWPTAFAGKFDPQYLAIPEAVLITSMKDNQRYFYARDAAGKMVNAFIGVRNGNSDHLEGVIAGNVKVLTARLEDAAFFYNEDKKKTIDQFVERLKSVSFHDKIGSMYDKMGRTTTIAGLLADQLNLSDADKQHLLRAASIYKFDLVSAMVGEFAELQGVMGEEYARLAGEDPAVATAIREHYMPISADGALPATTVGTLLALADKLESLMSFFAVDLIPSGSNDPYALRRQAYGIVRIIAAHDWSFDVTALQRAAVAALTENDQLAGLDYQHNQTALADFMRDRVSQYLGGQDVRHDILDAVVASRDVNLAAMLDAAKLLTKHADDADFKATMEALGRVVRIADKNPVNAAIATDLFENSTEKALNDAVGAIKADYTVAPTENNYQALRSLTPVITDYFTETMIMADDEAVKNNRLAQLSVLANMIHQFGDVTAVIVK